MPPCPINHGDTAYPIAAAWRVARTRADGLERPFRRRPVFAAFTLFTERPESATLVRDVPLLQGKVRCTFEGGRTMTCLCDMFDDFWNQCWDAGVFDIPLIGEFLLRLFIVIWNLVLWCNGD